MEESCNYLFDDNLECTLNRFQEMLKARKSKFFDVHEFEDIIDYYLDLQDIEYADEAIRYAMVQHPEALAIRVKQARLLLEKGAPDSALHLLDKLTPLENNNYEVYLLKGLALLSNDNIIAAQAYFEDAIALAEDNKEDVLFQIAINLLQFGLFKDALKYLHQAHDVNPENAIIIYELANTYANLENYAKSIHYYLLYLDYDPFAESIWNSLGQLYTTHEQFKEAVDAFDFAISINPMFTLPYHNKVKLYMQQGAYHKAINMLEELLHIDTDNVLVYYHMGECYKNINDFSAALHYFKKAKSVDETHANTWYGIGNVLYQQDKIKESIRYYEKALKYDHENPDYWFSLGKAFKTLNKTDKAIKAYHKVTNIDQHDDEAWNEQALLLKDQKKINEAIGLLNQAYTFNYSSARINYTLSVLYYLNDHDHLAVQYFEKGLQIDYSGYKNILDDVPKIQLDQRFVNLIRKYANQ